VAARTITLELTPAELAALYAVAQNGIGSADASDLEAIGLDSRGRDAAYSVWSKLITVERNRRLAGRPRVRAPKGTP
jgi:hypothetical protein